MRDIEYGFLDSKNPQEIEEAARVHESAPLNWNPAYVVTDSRVHATADVLHRIHKWESVFLYVARESSKLVGFHWVNLETESNHKWAKIDSLWVHESYRKQGIGKKLKLEGEAWAKKQGARFMKTGVFFSNPKMIEFNQKLGFVPQQVEMIKNL